MKISQKTVDFINLKANNGLKPTETLYYHVFGSHWDEYYETEQQAKEHFDKEVKAGNCCRVYEVFEDNESGEIWEGDCLYSYGEYPS